MRMTGVMGALSFLVVVVPLVATETTLPDSAANDPTGVADSIRSFFSFDGQSAPTSVAAAAEQPLVPPPAGAADLVPPVLPTLATSTDSRSQGTADAPLVPMAELQESSAPLVPQLESELAPNSETRPSGATLMQAFDKQVGSELLVSSPNQAKPQSTSTPREAQGGFKVTATGHSMTPKATVTAKPVPAKAASAKEVGASDPAANKVSELLGHALQAAGPAHPAATAPRTGVKTSIAAADPLVPPVALGTGTDPSANEVSQLLGSAVQAAIPAPQQQQQEKPKSAVDATDALMPPAALGSSTDPEANEVAELLGSAAQAEPAEPAQAKSAPAQKPVVKDVVSAVTAMPPQSSEDPEASEVANLLGNAADGSLPLDAPEANAEAAPSKVTAPLAGRSAKENAIVTNAATTLARVATKAANQAFGNDAPVAAAAKVSEQVLEKVATKVAAKAMSRTMSTASAPAVQTQDSADFIVDDLDTVAKKVAVKAVQRTLPQMTAPEAAAHVLDKVASKVAEKAALRVLGTTKPQKVVQKGAIPVLGSTKPQKVPTHSAYTSAKTTHAAAMTRTKTQPAANPKIGKESANTETTASPSVRTANVAKSTVHLKPKSTSASSAKAGAPASHTTAPSKSPAISHSVVAKPPHESAVVHTPASVPHVASLSHKVTTPVSIATHAETPSTVAPEEKVKVPSKKVTEPFSHTRKPAAVLPAKVASVTPPGAAARVQPATAGSKPASHTAKQSTKPTTVDHATPVVPTVATRAALPSTPKIIQTSINTSNLAASVGDVPKSSVPSHQNKQELSRVADSNIHQVNAASTKAKAVTKSKTTEGKRAEAVANKAEPAKLSDKTLIPAVGGLTKPLDATSSIIPVAHSTTSLQQDLSAPLIPAALAPAKITQSRPVAKVSVATTAAPVQRQITMNVKAPPVAGAAAKHHAKNNTASQQPHLEKHNASVPARHPVVEGAKVAARPVHPQQPRQLAVPAVKESPKTFKVPTPPRKSKTAAPAPSIRGAARSSSKMHSASKATVPKAAAMAPARKVAVAESQHKEPISPQTIAAARAAAEAAQHNRALEEQVAALNKKLSEDEAFINRERVATWMGESATEIEPAASIPEVNVEAEEATSPRTAVQPASTVAKQVAHAMPQTTRTSTKAVKAAPASHPTKPQPEVPHVQADKVALQPKPSQPQPEAPHLKEHAPTSRSLADMYTRPTECGDSDETAAHAFFSVPNSTYPMETAGSLADFYGRSWQQPCHAKSRTRSHLPFQWLETFALWLHGGSQGEGAQAPTASTTLQVPVPAAVSKPAPKRASLLNEQLTVTKQDFENTAKAVVDDADRNIDISDAFGSMEQADIHEEEEEKRQEWTAIAEAQYNRKHPLNSASKKERKNGPHISALWAGLEEQDQRIQDSLQDSKNLDEYLRLSSQQDASMQLVDNLMSGGYKHHGKPIELPIQEPSYLNDHLQEPWAALEAQDRKNEQQLKRNPNMRMLQLAAEGRARSQLRGASEADSKFHA